MNYELTKFEAVEGQPTNESTSECMCDKLNIADAGDELPCFECFRETESKEIVTDGGVVAESELEDVEIIDNEPDKVYEGPFPEYDRYGHPTGCSYVRCTSCRVEVLTGRKEFATHREDCRFGGDAR